MKRFIFILSLLMGVFVWQGCQTSASPDEELDDELGEEINGEENENGENDNKIFITDLTGKKWDVGHAFRKYGMKPENFQFGLGPDAIAPIISAFLVSPGEQGYPDNNEDFLVIGTRINGDARAYPLYVLSAHEIVDEKFGDTHVAVGY